MKFRIRGGRAARTVLLATTAVTAGALLLAGCSASPSASSTANPDNGTKLTMWVRDSDGAITQTLVNTYNKTHKNQVKLTIIPQAAFQEKVGTASGSHSLPDILSSDVVYSPNYVKAGLFQNITKQVTSLSFYKTLSHAHTQASTRNGKIYGVPFVIDSSLLIYNKTLFQQAGLDPNAAPKSFADIYNDAKTIRDKIGGNTYGFYFGGNCPGCNAYTMFPYLAAAGQPPFTNNGNTANFGSSAMKSTLSLYKKMWDEGIIAPAAKAEDGTTWTTAFNAGQIGILPVGTFDFPALKKVNFKWGIAALPAPDGSKASTFVGGDVATISRDSKHFAQAWNFLQWALGSNAQVNVLAKNGYLTSRVDLANNKYSAADPRVVQTIKGLATGYTPSATAYGTIVNSSTGLWNKLLRDYIFNNVPNALTTDQKAIQAVIDQQK